MSQQMNFQGGVNKKHTPSTASLSASEKGEASSQQKNFKCSVTPAKGYTPKSGPQVNFKNG